MSGRFQYILIGVGLVLVVAAALFSTRFSPAQANEVPSAAGSLPSGPNTLDQTTRPDLADEMPEAQSENNQLLLAKRQLFIDRWSESISETAVWLRRDVHYDRSSEDYGLLPDGRPIPEDFTFETWYQVDPNGDITALVQIMWDTEGTMAQVSTYREGVWRNLTFGGSRQGEPPVIKWGREFLAGSVVHVDYQQRYAEDRELAIFTMREGFAPARLDDLGGSFASGSITRETFDTHTGKILSSETFLLLTDGEEYMLDRLDYGVVEIVPAPPDEIVKLLNQETDSQEPGQ